MTDEQQSHPEDAALGEITFAGFVLSLAHTAAVHFGDVPDPISGASSPPNLAAAQQMIDILALLEQKTRGNLSAEERQLLDQLLYELRLRFIEVRARDAASETPPSGSRTPSGIIIP